MNTVAVQSSRHKCHKGVSRTRRVQRTERALSNQDHLKSFLKKMKYEWGFREQLGLGETERNGSK